MSLSINPNPEFGVFLTTRAEVYKDHEDPLFEEAGSIAQWSDFRFKTSDGKEFKFFSNLIGSIRKRLEAADVALSKRGKQRIDDLAGMIMDSDSTDPFVFSDGEPLAEAWLGLHVSSGVPLDDEEWEFFREIHNEALNKFYPDTRESENESESE